VLSFLLLLLGGEESGLLGSELLLRGLLLAGVVVATALQSWEEVVQQDALTWLRLPSFAL